MLENDYLQLNSSEKLRYYRTPILILIISFFCLTDGLQNLRFDSFNFKDNVLDKLGVFLLVTGLLSVFYLYHKLKFKPLEYKFEKNYLRNVLSELAKEKNWTFTQKTNRLIIFETQRFKKNGHFYHDYISPSLGEKIYVIIEHDKILIKSIHDFEKNYNFIIGFEENKSNEKIITEKIKSAANTS